MKASAREAQAAFEAALSAERSYRGRDAGELCRLEAETNRTAEEARRLGVPVGDVRR